MPRRVRHKIGIALAGGGPLGAIYEIGALVALQDALKGLDLSKCGIHVGVSAGGVIAAGLANGYSPRDMHAMFIESENAAIAFDPDLLLRPAFAEYARRIVSLPGLIRDATRRYLDAPLTHGFFESFQKLARAVPTGVFDNVGFNRVLTQILNAPGRTNDFRQLGRKLFVVATDLDSARAVAFGSPGWDHVPISRAVQASAALPGLFPPVEIDGRHYVDGALVKTLHASVALKEGAELLICVNPLVPFNADLAHDEGHREPYSLVDYGLPAVMSQTFRAIIHSRMKTGMDRYRTEFPDADVVLFEAGRGDAEMFFTNIFSYSGRKRLAEHAYRRTLNDLRRRQDQLAPVLARHGVEIDEAVLHGRNPSIAGRGIRRPPPLAGLSETTAELDSTLDRLTAVLRTRAAAAS
ncbi:MAG: patatin-like phospholipase family protein [Phyllobacteriaceae bacterium]|nr:patatin-like phospholipase family protein [Phyllobacteriaceae bacterium]